MQLQLDDQGYKANVVYFFFAIATKGYKLKQTSHFTGVVLVLQTWYGKRLQIELASGRFSKPCRLKLDPEPSDFRPEPAASAPPPTG
jgi:hypothetical protein